MPAHRRGAHPEIDRAPVAALGEQLCGNDPVAVAETPVGFLERDDVGVDFRKHVENALRRSLAVEPDALAHGCSWRP